MPMMDKNGKQEKKNLLKSYADEIQIFIYDWLKTTSLFSQILLFLLTAFILTYFSMPESVMLNLPTEDTDVGKIMKFSLRADRDYKIIDEKKTQDARLKAADEIMHHFQWIDNSVHYKKVRDAFKIMRNFIDEYLLTHLKKTKSDTIPEKFLPLSVHALKKNIHDPAFKKIKDGLIDALNENKALFEKEIGVPVDNTVFEMLSNMLFDKQFDAILFSIINRLNSYYIYRSGLDSSYTLNRIKIKKGDGLFSVVRNRVITGSSLFSEIEYTLNKLNLKKKLTENGSELVTLLAYWVVRDNLSFDAELTEKKKMAALNSAPLSTFFIKNGEIIRRAGEVITEKDIKVFREILTKSGQKSLTAVFLQNFFYILIVILVSFVAFKRSVSKFSYKNKDLILMSLQAMLAFVFYDLIVSLSIPFSQWMGNIDARIFLFFLPFPFIVAAVRLLINTETAVFFLIVLLLIFLTIFPDNFYFPAYYASGALFFMFLVTHIEKRSNILKVSFILSLLLMGMTIIIFNMDMTLPKDNMLRALMIAFINGILSGLLIMGIIPLWEWWLGYTTDITFLEFSTLNHPLMKKMAVHANGTYQHSLTVGSIVETAAREIGVSPLACKVMSYFHDIGKLDRPEYFAENQSGKNKHDELSASMSSMVIINHIKRGVNLARQYKLGEKIEAAVAEHQGTSLVKYFFNKAKENDSSVREEMFRYPGPKPQTKEVGLLMLADSVEAAIRSMPDKNYQRIRDGVHNILNRIMEDGQLSECSMTLRDLAKIEESFVKTLSGIYHARIEYQEPVA